MDDILSPKRAAKVKAACGMSFDQSDTDESGEEQESDTHDTDDTEKESSEDQEHSQASDHAPSHGCRRSSRKLSNGSIPNYDSKYVIFPLLVKAFGHHSFVDDMELDFIPPLTRLCVQLLPGLR